MTSPTARVIDDAPSCVVSGVRGRGKGWWRGRYKGRSLAPHLTWWPPGGDTPCMTTEHQSGLLRARVPGPRRDHKTPQVPGPGQDEKTPGRLHLR